MLDAKQIAEGFFQGAEGSGSVVPVLAQEPEPGLIGYSLAELRAVKFPPRKTILYRAGVPVLRAGDLAEVYAQRGCGKTWFSATLALSAAAGIEGLGFEAPAPRRTVVIDGEMSAEALRGRYEALMGFLQIDADIPLKIVAADWQRDPMARLDTREGQRAVEPFLEDADFVILDNRSCLFDAAAETDALAWMPAQNWLLALRRRGKAVLMVHHSNRAGGARGHSKAEDILDVCLKLSRPEDAPADEGARFKVEWEKMRGIPPGPATSPFVARLTESGWQVEGGAAVESSAIERKIVAYLQTMESLGERPKSATAVARGAGVNKQVGLRTLDAMRKAGRVVQADGYALAS